MGIVAGDTGVGLALEVIELRSGKTPDILEIMIRTAQVEGFEDTGNRVGSGTAEGPAVEIIDDPAGLYGTG
jgi:hypothetical protein